MKKLETSLFLEKLCKQKNNHASDKNEPGFDLSFYIGQQQRPF